MRPTNPDRVRGARIAATVLTVALALAARPVAAGDGAASANAPAPAKAATQAKAVPPAKASAPAPAPAAKPAPAKEAKGGEAKPAAPAAVPAKAAPAAKPAATTKEPPANLAKARPAGANAAAPRRAAPATPASAQLDEQVTYQYNALGRRDPFQSLIGGEYVGADVGGGAPPDIGGIRVVGIVWGDADQFALVEDVRGDSHILRRGDKVMNGFVESLKRDAMIVQLTVDGQSQMVSIPLTRKGDKSNANR